MRGLDTKNKYRKMLKMCYKRGYDMSKIAKVVRELQETGTLPPKNKAHKLVGNKAGKWECHIEPDWLLIYLVDDETLTLLETGTHSDLFVK